MLLTKILFPLFVLFMTAAGTVNATVAVRDNKPIKNNLDSLTEVQRARIKVLENRVVEIKAMDRSTLNKADRKALRRELKDLNKEARRMGGKTFVLLLGVLIAAILLLILLL